ncbi:biotin--acetyl-CoA-carboxylase ligase [Bifidobacterium pullorum subsp. saeculare]|uniref:Biotin--acetyl-CoA-carboxylase ligase n=1 Tax=Bifidobacterium pullorum subsp. saeculare TaxID=78257 RepID=A0A938WXY3_9BIFI|nr:biotin--acetyl-CoA-carboxylase ligase [Bifidobacterium pullorum]MBM6700344.1 biotin--acetyl-CoA-carboxylase ligase [Bifidobacterium pullorum subsp. saeculare]
MATMGTPAPRLPRTQRAAARVVAVAETPSTNALAQRMTMDGSLRVTAGEVAVVSTGRQTAGRGRLDHTWVSRPGESFTMSFVTAVPQAVLADESVNGWIQMLAGLAALDGIEEALAGGGARWRGGVSPLALKWPNDVFADGRKLGGILCQACFPGADVIGSADETDGANAADGSDTASEADVASEADAAGGAGVAVTADGSDDRNCDSAMAAGGPRSDNGTIAAGGPGNGRGSAGRDTVVVVGIGLNLRVPADRVPGGVATSLHLLADGLPGADELVDRIAAGIVASLGRRLAEFLADPRDAAVRLRGEVTPRCWTLGRRAVAHYLDGSELEGTAVALNADASLTLRVADGAGHETERVVRTADVGVLPQ